MATLPTGWYVQNTVRSGDEYYAILRHTKTGTEVNATGDDREEAIDNAAAQIDSTPLQTSASRGSVAIQQTTGKPSWHSAPKKHAKQHRR